MVWQRAPDPAFVAWVDALDPARLPTLRVWLPHTRVREAVALACDSAGTPAGAGRDRLIGDVGALALLLARASGTPRVRVRLEAVRGDSCHRFHIDRVRLRLLCTYRGPGTEYGVASSGETPATVHQLARGDAALFRGRLWPGETTGLVHRSPPLTGTGQTRLLLVMDPDDPEED